MDRRLGNNRVRVIHQAGTEQSRSLPIAGNIVADADAHFQEQSTD